MALNINVVHLAGNLTRDPQVRFLANEKAVAEFGLAINRRWKTQDGTAKEETTFVDVVAWGRTAELAGQYLTKGSGAYVEGRLHLDTWDDKETGQKRSRLRVVADSIQFTTPKGERTESAGEEPPYAPRRHVPAAGGDEVDTPPF